MLSGASCPAARRNCRRASSEWRGTARRGWTTGAPRGSSSSCCRGSSSTPTTAYSSTRPTTPTPCRSHPCRPLSTTTMTGEDTKLYELSYLCCLSLGVWLVAVSSLWSNFSDSLAVTLLYGLHCYFMYFPILFYYSIFFGHAPRFGLPYSVRANVLEFLSIDKCLFICSTVIQWHSFNPL